MSALLTIEGDHRDCTCEARRRRLAERAETTGRDVMQRAAAAAVLSTLMVSHMDAQMPALDSVVEQPYTKREVVEIRIRTVMSGAHLDGVRSIAVAGGTLAVVTSAGREAPRIQLFD